MQHFSTEKEFNMRENIKEKTLLEWFRIKIRFEKDTGRPGFEFWPSSLQSTSSRVLFLKSSARHT